LVLKNENSKFLGGYLIDQDPSEQGKQKESKNSKIFVTKQVKHIRLKHVLVS